MRQGVNDDAPIRLEFCRQIESEQHHTSDSFSHETGRTACQLTIEVTVALVFSVSNRLFCDLRLDRLHVEREFVRTFEERIVSLPTQNPPDDRPRDRRALSSFHVP